MQRANASFPQNADRRLRLMSFVDRHSATWLGFLLFVYFLLGFLGSDPLSGGIAPKTTGGTNLFRQIVLIGLFCGAAPILVVYRARLADVLRVNLLPLAIYGWLAASTLWSTHPPLTIRRVIAEFLVLALLAAAVTVMRSWRLILFPAAAAAVLIILMDMAAVLLAPGLAIGPIGAMGVHTNKNLAGVITLIALILCGGTLLARRNLRLTMALLPVIALGFVFLVLTKSKTSLGLAVLIYAAFPAFYLVFKRWSAAPALVPVALVSAIALATFAVASLGISRSAVLEFVFGDATLTRRTELWAFLQGNIDQRPYLGSGWGAFWDTGAKINPINAPPQSWVLPATEINTAHSGYIDLWVQSGVIGLAILGLVIIRSVWVYGCLLRQRQWGVENDRLIATMFALILALVLYNFLESILFRPADCLSSLFVIGVLAGESCYQRMRRVLAAAPPAGAATPMRQSQPVRAAPPFTRRLPPGGGTAGNTSTRAA